MLFRAVVSKLATRDGLVAFEPHVELGQEVVVDLTTIHRAHPMMRQLPNGTYLAHVKDLIWTWDGTWLPLETLTLVWPDGTPVS